MGIITQNGQIVITNGNVLTYEGAEAPTLQSKIVSPTTSQQMVTADPGYDGLSSVQINLTTQAAQTLYPSTTDQTITSGKYLTGTQTFKGVLLTNLDAGNIKKDVVVKVGDSADDDRITSVTGTYRGGVSEPEKDVNYIDYDGTILYSYTKAEFASLSAHPANPAHDGLTAQGWNWTLSDAKTYVATYGKLWIGQMYITSDGKTRIYIHLEKGRLSPYLGIAVDGTATVEWGDGSSNDTVTGSDTWNVISTPHNYAAAGDYVIAISVSGSIAFIGDDMEDSGSWVLWNNNDQYGAKNKVYQNAIQRVEIGANTFLRYHAFEECGSLSSITMPSSINFIDSRVFSDCCRLSSVTIPNSVEGIYDGAFVDCVSLTNIAIPNSVIEIYQSVFQRCYSLATITMPGDTGNNHGSLFSSCDCLSSITVFNNIDTYMFSGCSSLANITILSGVTSIGAYAFNNCYGLGEIHFRPTSPPTVSNTYTFNSLSSDCIIYVPTGCLSAYQSATNYPNPNTYTYMEE